MSTPFTSPADATWQALLDEITTAWRERCLVVGTSYAAGDGRDVQSWVYWAYMQGWLETTSAFFIDHVSSPLNPAGMAFLTFTLDAFQEAAGLNRSAILGESFRRATVWDGATTPTWEYGYMQAGDIIGPWIFEDIQKGFGALRWALENPSSLEWKNKNSLVENYGTPNDACSIAKSISEGKFGSLPWLNGSHYDYHHNGGYDMGLDIYGHEYGCEAAVNARNYWSWNNFRSKVKYIFAEQTVPRQLNIYVSPGGATVGGSGQTGFNDIDNVFPGWPENGPYLIQSLVETKGVAVCDKLWINGGTPSKILNLTCPSPWPPGGAYPWGGHWGWGASANFWGCLSKWNFTNT